MKYTYKKIYKKIENLNSFQNVASAITCAMMGDASKIKEINNGQYIEVLVGGTFYPESGNLEETELYLTDLDVINRNKDYDTECLNYIASFFGELSYAKRDGLVGKWTDDIDKNGNVYYIIDGTDIRKMIMCRYDGFGYSNQGGIQYIVQEGDNMVDCLLDDGDLLFTDYKEAQKYVKSLTDKKPDKKSKKSETDGK